MSVRIRLARGGTKKRPFYRIVATDKRSPRDGRFLEKLGSYNPLLPTDNPERIVLREERIRHWLSAGALPSDRVCRFLDAAGITENTVKHRGTGKRAEEIAAKKAEADAAAAEAKAEADEKAAADKKAADEKAAADAEAAKAAEAEAEAAPAEEEAAPAEEAPAEEAPADSTEKAEASS